MEPQYFSGDLVVARAASEYRIDDIVIFRALGRPGYVIHRIVGGDAAGGWTTRGDGNTRSDRWTVADEAILGREWLVIPRLARSVVAVQHSPLRFAAAVGIAVSSLMLLFPSGQNEPRTTRVPARGGERPVTSVAGPSSDVLSYAPLAPQRREPDRQQAPNPFDDILARLDVMLSDLARFD
jgi:hypothetical protein